MLDAYPKIYRYGAHKDHLHLLEGDVNRILVQEKIDGSQISFMAVNDQLYVRSRNRMLCIDNPDKQWQAAIQSLKDRLPLIPQRVVFRGEYLSTPKHNTLGYDRVPVGHIMLFEPTEYYRVNFGFEWTPTTLYDGRVDLTTYLNGPGTSILGGSKIEGVVVKNKNNGVMAKLVRPEFQETHKKDWAERHPHTLGIEETFSRRFKSTRRFEKAVQRLRDEGQLTGQPQDIPLIVRTVQDDLVNEEREAIMTMLFDHYVNKFRKLSTQGLAEWYKGSINL